MRKACHCPPARGFQHTLLDPVQRHVIRKWRAVTEDQCFEPGQTGQQPFQVSRDNTGQRVLTGFRQRLMDISLQIQPQVIGTTGKRAIRRFQHFSPVLLQLEALEQCPLVCPWRLNACTSLRIRGRDGPQGVMTQAFHQMVR